jgi:hypothetical protein
MTIVNNYVKVKVEHVNTNQQAEDVISTKQKQKVARSATLTQIKGLCEVCKNILLGNLPVSSIQKDTLKKHRNKLRKFADRSIPLKVKRKSIGQRGGWLGPVAAIALPFIASLMRK